MPGPLEQRLSPNPYRNLVLLALVTLSGHRNSPGLLEDAHRLVTGALPRGRRHPRPHEYARVRRRVLRRSLFPRSWHPRGQAGMRVSPVDGTGGEVRALEALEGLDSPARAAYALMRMESLDAQAATALLASVGVREAATAVERAREVPATLRLPDPTVVRVSGRGSLMHRRGLVAAAGVLVLAVAALGLTGAGTSGGTGVTTFTAPPPRLAGAVAPDSWRESFRLDLTAWHPRGEAVGDDALVRRSLAAWTEQEGHVPGRAPSGPALLFAGEVADRDVVLLHDGPRVARYTREGGEELVEVFAEPGNGVANWPALRLADTDAGTHYLLPPWVSEADTAPLGQAGADWSEVGHEDGVTEALPTGEHCGVGPVLRLRAPEVAHGEPYTAIDLGGLDTAHLGYMPPPPAEIRRLGPHEVLAPEQGFDLWGELACAGAPPEGPVRTATAWEFAVQELPGGGEGRWACVRFGAHDGGGLARAVLVAQTDDGTETIVAGEREGGWDCSNLNRQVAAGTWWQDADGRWHYLAAASREVDTITAVGGVEGSGEDGSGFLAVSGPRSDSPPVEEVVLTALDAHGDEMTVLSP
ncbi:hypothetical protein [Nocardiopsis metallicus]|uniref:DNA-directed RNA polymerase specialized sigma24 family protein n=1 Tax=Nocardiopsis metallicus TaxID=179819 RepID=A0A840WDJ9_9ACTN|nr:hypothetical protein [Nocardiopsis metallicus]MBB5489817.1 hypothetical protein [Nocardiopsis metallicus]